MKPRLLLSRLRPPRSVLLGLTSLLLVSFICVVLAELLLRLLWTNPMTLKPLGLEYPGYIRIQLPNITLAYNTQDLYEGAQHVVFKTGAEGEVVGHPLTDKPLAHFYGGSTTECRYIAQGARWPEQVSRVSGKNFGVSGNNLIDSYFNFKFHLETGHTPKYAFFMHAVNDFSNRNIFSEEAYLKSRGAERKSNVPPQRMRFYLSDFIRNLYNALAVDNSVKHKLVAQLKAENTKALRPLDDIEFKNFVRQRIDPFLAQRRLILEKIDALSRAAQVQMILVTQPHAYKAAYHPAPYPDLRQLPEIEGQRSLTMAQAEYVLGLINENSRAFARDQSVPLIDVDAEFNKRDAGPLFYDSVHYTEAGSRLFGKIVDEAFAKVVQQ